MLTKLHAVKNYYTQFTAMINATDTVHSKCVGSEITSPFTVLKETKETSLKFSELNTRKGNGLGNVSVQGDCALS
jgi:hypothetical protein